MKQQQTTDKTRENLEEHLPHVEETKSTKHGAFSNLDRSISVKDLKNPVVAKMLMEKVDDLQTELLELEGYRDKYHDSCTKNAVYEETLKGQKRFQIVHSLCLTIGGIILGSAFSSADKSSQIPMFITGALFLVIGEVSNWSGRK